MSYNPDKDITEAKESVMRRLRKCEPGSDEEELMKKVTEKLSESSVILNMEK